MPQVTAPEYPSVSPSSGGISGINISPPADAFGAATAAATQRFGQQVDTTGNMLATHANQMQDDLNEAINNEAVTRNVIKQAEIQTEFKQKVGSDAFLGMPEYHKKLEDARMEIRNSLGNPAIQKMFDRETMRQFGYAVTNGAVHAATEFKRYTTGAAAARVSDATQRALQDPYNDHAFEMSVDEIKKNAVTAADAKGLSPEAQQQEIIKATSHAWSVRLQSMAYTDPLHARQLLDSKRAEMTGEEAINAERVINQQTLNVESRHVADRVLAGVGRAGYEKAVFGAESGNDPNARSSSSSATGLAQFTKGTWDDLRQRHPELNLTANGRTDADQSRRGFQVFTSENADKLKGEGIQETGQNLYAAHFLGAQGAIDLIKGVQSDPRAPASKFVDSDSIASNRAIFYDGARERTASEVYMLLGRKMGAAAGPLTTGSPVGQLNAMVEEAKRQVDTLAGVPEHLKDELRSAAVDKVKTGFNSVKAVANDSERANREKVFTAAMGDDPMTAPKDYDELPPDARKAYDESSIETQRATRRVFASNTKADYPTSQETWDRYSEILRLARSTDPKEKDEFSKMNIGDEEIPRAYRSKLLNLQLRMNEQTEGETHLMKNLAVVKAQIVAQVPQLATNKKLMADFQARFEEQSEIYQQENKGKRMPEKDAIALANGLVKQVVTGSTFFGFGEAKAPLFNAPVPEDYKKNFIEAWKEKRPGQPIPDDAMIRRFYQASKIRGGNTPAASVPPTPAPAPAPLQEQVP